MRVRKFYANSMPEAMAQIRAELGTDAVILHSEKKRSGGFLGLFKRPRLEVTAAVDTDLRDFPVPSRAVNDDIKKMQTELSGLKMTLSKVTETQQIEARAREIHHSSGGYNGLPRITSLDAWYQRLLDQDVGADLARLIIQTVADELSRWALDNEEVLNEHLHWHIGRQLVPPVPLNFVAGQPKTYFVVGPTGVGKTTTLAKLAANFKRAHSANVLMITADTYRVAAIPQFKAFGEILGIPVEVAYTPSQLAELVQASRHYDLILVDTPGRSHRATAEVNELGDFLAAVPNKTVHLTMAAGTQYKDMKHIVNAFGTMPLDGFILTKTDETVSMGAAYTLACETRVPLSYLTTGQRVPEDIEVASAEKVVDLLVGSVPDEIRSTMRQRIEMNNGKKQSVDTYSLIRGEF